MSTPTVDCFKLETTDLNNKLIYYYGPRLYITVKK